MPKEWVPEDWGSIHHMDLVERRNALQPIWESEGKNNHCIRSFSEDEFEMIEPTLVNRFGEEWKDLIMRYNFNKLLNFSMSAQDVY